MTVTDLITATAQQYGVDPALALAVGRQESGLNQNARGAAGEIGVFQLLPATAAGLGVDPTDLAQNVQGGVKYLRMLIDQFGDLRAALAAYNWGPGNVAAKGWQAAPASTQAYIAAILGGAPAPGGGVQSTANGLPVYALDVFGLPLVPDGVIVLFLLAVLLLTRKG